MKRSATNNINTRSKRPCLVTLESTNENRIDVSATHTFNYMRNDCLVDVFRYNHKSFSPKLNSNSVDSKGNSFSDFLMRQGCIFEDTIITKLRDKGFPIITVSNKLTDETYKNTIELIRNGTPILHSVPLINKKDQTRGIADLVVRSDWINKLFTCPPLSDSEVEKNAYRISKHYHYVVIDIKFCTLSLRSDGTHLSNSGNYPAYKVQLNIYNKALGLIQGYTPSYTFLLGRGWKSVQKGVTFNCNDSFEKLGRVCFTKFDNNIPKLSLQAVNWVRKVRDPNQVLCLNPPNDELLYPNMCVDSGKWNKSKTDVAKEIDEITLVWNVGVRERKKAREKGIKSWRDPKCNSSILGFTGKRGKVVDAILDINRSEDAIVMPKAISGNFLQWKNTKEVFVDFETIPGVVQDIDKSENENRIFLIGVGRLVSGIWEYKSFTCSVICDLEEFRICNDFMEYIKELDYPLIRFWSAEKRFWTAVEQRLFESGELDDDKKETICTCWSKLSDKGLWTDLCSFFREEPIVVKGCFKFGLKEIAGAMYRHNLINTRLTEECDCGLSAMLMAVEYYKSKNASVLGKIVRYNEFDCKVMYDMIDYLRLNHVN